MISMSRVDRVRYAKWLLGKQTKTFRRFGFTDGTSWAGLRAGGVRPSPHEAPSGRPQLMSEEG